MRELYEDLGASQKVMIDLGCSSHNAMWEKNHTTLFRASLEWLEKGTVNGVEDRRAAAGILIAVTGSRAGSSARPTIRSTSSSSIGGRRARCRASRFAGAELAVLFEAARWAPSAGNTHPWRILYAHRDTEHWPLFFDLLVERNKVWCRNAAALLLFISRTTNEQTGRPLVTHSYDTGAAWENLALQGTLRGLVVHGMAGLRLRARADDAEHPGRLHVEAMAAVGKPGPIDDAARRLSGARITEHAEADQRADLRRTVSSLGLNRCEF